MSNRELLERCLVAVSVSDYVGYDILMNDIRAELHKPSQSEELNLAEYWKREYDQLEAKLRCFSPVEEIHQISKDTIECLNETIEQLKAKLAEAEK